MHTKVLESLLHAYWREYCRQVGQPNMAVADCGPMAPEINLEHKIVAMRLQLLWDALSPGDIDAVRVCGSNQIVDPMMVVPDDEWLPCAKADDNNDTSTHLICSIDINGTPMALSAYQIDEDKIAGQYAVNRQLEPQVHHLRQIENFAGPLRTTKIRDRTYLITATPLPKKTF